MGNHSPESADEAKAAGIDGVCLCARIFQIFLQQRDDMLQPRQTELIELARKEIDEKRWLKIFDQMHRQAYELNRCCKLFILIEEPQS